MQAPRDLQTERLRPAPVAQGRFPPLSSRFSSDPEVHRHFGPEPMGQEECWRRLPPSVGMWDAARLRRLGGGAQGGRQADRHAQPVQRLARPGPEFGDEPEMGWIFATEAHGQGMAGEACRAVLDWAEANLEPTPIWAIIAPENAPSLEARRQAWLRARRATRFTTMTRRWSSSARPGLSYQPPPPPPPPPPPDDPPPPDPLDDPGAVEADDDRARQRIADRADEPAGVVPRTATIPNTRRSPGCRLVPPTPRPASK